MKQVRIIFIFSTLLLALLSACAPATPTGGCTQGGCPYPAVCDLKTGICTINQGQGPVAAAPQQPGAGIINNGQPPLNSIAPTATLTPTLMPPLPNAGNPVTNAKATPDAPNSNICNPPMPSITNFNDFCANMAAGIGGASFTFSPSQNAINYTTGNGVSCQSNGQGKIVCTGQKNSLFGAVMCTSCAAPNAPTTYGSYVCSSGYVEDASGNCNPANPSDPSKTYSPCPEGSAWDNVKQACVDGGTGIVNPQCPGGYDNYLPDKHFCLANPYPEVFNCQGYYMVLGACEQIKKPQGQAGVCPPGQTLQYNPATGTYVCK